MTKSLLSISMRKETALAGAMAGSVLVGGSAGHMIGHERGKIAAEQRESAELASARAKLKRLTEIDQLVAVGAKNKEELLDEAYGLIFHNSAGQDTGFAQGVENIYGVPILEVAARLFPNKDTLTRSLEGVRKGK